MKDSRLEVKLSSKLKTSFMSVCEEREISASDAVRDFIAKTVRNHKQGRGKGVDLEV